jgi:hypothetical protein
MKILNDSSKSISGNLPEVFIEKQSIEKEFVFFVY